MGWKAALVGGVAGFFIGFLFRVLVNILFFPGISTFEEGLTKTLFPSSRIDVLLNFFVPIPYVLFGALLGYVYYRRKPVLEK
jgi:hypothetical protein